MRKITIIFYLLFLGGSSLGFAQQDAQFTQYLFNKLFINPAFAGVEQNTQISFIHRSQWAGYQASFDDGGAPATQVLSYHTAFPKFNSGIGFNAVLDRLGPLSNIELQLSYAYHVEVANNSRLSVGVRGGIYARIVDFDQYRLIDIGDPLVTQEGTQSVIKPDMAVGVYWHNPKYFVGFTANHLTSASFSFGDGFNRDPLVNSFYLMGGYTFNLDRNEKWLLTPNFLLKSSELKEYSFDVGALLEYDEKVWLGTSYRNEESINVLIGVIVPRNIVKKGKPTVQHNLRLGFGFDYVYSGRVAKETASYELMLSYDLPVKLPKFPALIRTPQFRY